MAVSILLAAINAAALAVALVEGARMLFERSKYIAWGNRIKRLD